MDAGERVIEFIGRTGPVVPVQVGKFLGVDTIFASAHLSELASRKKLLISHLKIGGGSPLYYLSQQKAELQRFSSNLSEKEQRTYELLKEKKVLRESVLSPLQQVVIRDIKDFAVPLEITFNGVKEVFWKWYLADDQEADALIREILMPQEQKNARPVEEEAAKIPEHAQAARGEDEQEPGAEAGSSGEGTDDAGREEEDAQGQKRQPSGDEFLDEVYGYFSKLNIKVKDEQVIRKAGDAEFVVLIPSAVGELRYFCKAKKKARINEGDLSSAFIESQSRKLPTLFLTTGKLTKKAEEMLAREFRGMQVRPL